MGIDALELKKGIRQQIEKLLDMDYRKRLKHRRMSYADWIREKETQSAAESKAQKAEVSCDREVSLVLLAFEDGDWSMDAKARMKEFFARNPQVMIAYGDEDVRDEKGGYGNPWLKPCWSPDSYLCRDYLGNAVAVRRELYEQLGEAERADAGSCHDGLIRLAGGFERGCTSIAHVSGIFFHRTKPWTLPGEGRRGFGGDAPAQFMTTQENAGEAGRAEEVEVSVIIPSKDNVPVLTRCLETLCQTVRSLRYEIIVVDNGSCGEAQEAVAGCLERLKADPAHRDCLQNARYLYQPMTFNFSRMCNIGAEAAEGRFLLFLNDDIEAVEEGWLEEMAEMALRPWVGAVGRKLLYPDGERIQHAGVTNITLGPAHKLQCLKNGRPYYDGRGTGIWDMLAVTGACLLLRRETFAEAGGFCERLQVAFNDVDLCFNLYKLGYHNVVINSSYLLHHESLSRGADETEEKFRRFMGEYNLLFERHLDLKSRDPYYHPWLNADVLDPAIKPAFEEGIAVGDVRDYEAAEDLGNFREDDCLLFRMEIAESRKVYGYAVVLGSDNACFTKKLLFRSKVRPEEIYEMRYTEQYRSDLEKNMEDQTNIALCGFRVDFARPLPPGDYQIGVMARDRISGAALLNWSSRVISGEETAEAKQQS